MKKLMTVVGSLVFAMSVNAGPAPHVVIVPHVYVHPVAHPTPVRAAPVVRPVAVPKPTPMPVVKALPVVKPVILKLDTPPYRGFMYPLMFCPVHPMFGFSYRPVSNDFEKVNSDIKILVR